MMILPSEENIAGAFKAIPSSLLDRVVVDRKNVFRLEFHTLDRATPDISLIETEIGIGSEIIKLKQEIASLKKELQSQTFEQTAQIEAMCSETRTEVRQEWQNELEERIAQERATVLRACDQFGRERVKYFAAIETEVVKLAMAIATRVLHRESKLDPMLLTASVRLALEKIKDDSTTILRAHSSDLEHWRSVIASKEFAGTKVQLLVDSKMSIGECALDTKMGTVELGMSAQLHEIESGFFDLLQKRPI